MMLRLFRRNLFLHLNPIRNGASSNHQTYLTVSFFSSASNLPYESESPPKKGPILDFFLSYGFTDPQIRRFIHKCPSVRSTQTIKPKLEHLLAYGFSPSDLVKTICFYPTVLACSLKKRIEPNLKLLEATLGSKTHIIKAIIRGPPLLSDNLEKRVIPNVLILRENNIPTDMINLLFMRFPRVLLKDPSVIIETIGKLKGLGMRPSTTAFIQGMSIMAMYKKETWERKLELYQSLGWSEKDTLSVFSRQPTCLQRSDDEIKKKMNFFNEKLEWDPVLIAKRPIVLMYSLEGRIIPRCAVLSVLAKKKLWEGKPTLYNLFVMAERNFEERFVNQYENKVPQVVDAYEGKVEFIGFDPSIVLNQ